MRSLATTKAVALHFHVSVIIPCLNEAARIGGLLDGIRSQDSPVFEVVIVDTGSTDGTPEVVARYQRRWPELTLRRLAHPGASIAEAVNKGIQAAGGAIIVRLDGHSRPAPDYVRRALDALGVPGTAVVGGVWDTAPGGDTRIAQAIAMAVAHPVGAGDAAYRTVGGTDGGRRRVDTVPFGCFHKTTWTALGGFNQALRTNEDYEFNYRARLSGGAVVLDPAIRCTYFARHTLAGLARQYLRYGWWKAQMLKRHPRSLRWRQVVPAALVPTFGALAVAGFLWPAGRFLLGGVVLAYAAVLLAAAGHLAHGRRGWDLLGALVAAFATVHVTWSFGFGLNLVFWGRWPRWG